MDISVEVDTLEPLSLDAERLQSCVGSSSRLRAIRSDAESLVGGNPDEDWTEAELNQMANWRGHLHYFAKATFGSRAWRSYFREIRHPELDQISRNYLDTLLRHACDHVPFYRDLGLQRHALTDFPIVGKGDLRSSHTRHLRDDMPGHSWPIVRTSGSTGDTFEAVRDTDALAWAEAADMWYYETLLATSQRAYVIAPKVFVWHQRLDDRTARSRWTRVKRALAPILWLDPFEALSQERLLVYAREINRMNPRYVWGYPGVLYEIVRAARQANLSLPKPEFVISSGETLHGFMRPVIEEGFGCGVFDYYGSAEVGRVAGECSAGNLHVFTFNCHAEVLDNLGAPVGPGQQGRLVLTALHNLAMPLIRYDVADWAEVGPKECPCGSSLPSLSRILGRDVEFFVSSQGDLISGGMIANLLRRCPWVMSFQVVQKDIDRIDIYFYSAPGAEIDAQDQRHVDADLSKLLGVECQIEWIEVQEIPRTPGGKRPYVRGLVWKGQLPRFP